MELSSSVRSPREEGELEDGEISDDDTDERQFVRRDKRPSSSCNSSAGRFARKPKPGPRTLPPPPMGGPGLDFRMKMPFNRGPHSHPPNLTGHRQQSGAGVPDRSLSAQHCDSGPRSSFWERSHTALGRLRYRRPNDGRGDWGRGGWGEGVGGRGTGRPPPCRLGFAGAPIRKESPPRKPKLFGRPQVRKPIHNTAKTENGIEESFEDLLLKYKQIQHELECIRKEERMALSSKDPSPQKEVEGAPSVDQAVSGTVSIQKEAAIKESPPPEKPEIKVFQAFNLKPLRQKLLTPMERDEMNKKNTKEAEKSENAEISPLEPCDTIKDKEDEEELDLNNSYQSSKESDDLPYTESKDDDDELSELQLRLLALQSASKKWQQKEQQVLKESKEKLTKAKQTQEKGKAAAKTHPVKKNIIPGSAAKQAWRKQQVRTWKLQQQKEQEKPLHEESEEQRHAEEEERRKREDEIRKIRDLSNQDEQYNRFMKLVGGKRRSRSKSLDTEHRKSLNKQGTDTSGNLYQYDNYDEVAMDTDSETNSPASSPAHNPFLAEEPSCFLQVPQFPVDVPPHTMLFHTLNQRYLDPPALSPSDPEPPLPPLPPDEPEQPPKPPFADEEEEEEMLLREELLKSLASKRAVKSEETSSNSGPPSPPMNITVQVMPRNNLSTVSMNMGCQPRQLSTKFVRGPPAPRPLLVLPRHKAVVVQLNDSDDSESEGEAPAAESLVFGGLESMIKEARRTVEASKPKAPSGPEKENNPLKTLETLPDVKKFEYRLLKEEIASREKQKLLSSDRSRGIPSPANCDVELDIVGRGTEADLQILEAENKLKKHKNLLLKDELLLKHLLQQELKKKESLRASETKMVKLKEQLLATEKIVHANKTLLKKLQEQIHRVQHRVSLKKHQAVKLEKDLAQAKVFASHGGMKRKNETTYLSPSKMLRLDSSPSRSPGKQFAEMIAREKKRLQQLESEYALKIQKLKEAQALRNRELQEVAASVEEGPPSFTLPQPSLHDLTQDKLTLDSEENEAEDEELSPSIRERRRSFRESGAFTKPNLKHTEAAPSKESLSKPSKKTVDEPELFFGLKIEDLQKHYEESESLTELIEGSTSQMLASTGKPLCSKKFTLDLDVTSQTSRVELTPCPFGPYHSPLLVFKSYRFSPYFRTKEKLSLSSITYSNIIEPKKFFCRFDLTGTCNDDDCQWQHMRNCTLTGKQLFQDIVSYNLTLIGCSETSTKEEISIATEKYINKLFGMNKDRMGTDQMAVLLVSKVNESKGHIPPYTTCKDIRKWRPQQLTKAEPETGNNSSDEDEENAGSVKYEQSRSESSWGNSSALDACVTPDDVRYFTSETDDISNLEASVLESSRDVQLWIKLAYKYLSQKDSSSSECLDSALNTLARALEHNRENPEVWCHYLSLFSKRGTKEEVQEMCETAVEYAPDYQVWWKFLNLESSFDGKDYVCCRIMQYLLGTAGGDKSELVSFQLLESLLYRVQLSLFTGRHQNALALLQNALKSTSDEKSIAEHLTRSDRCLAWLAYIHLAEFNSLPSSLYDPANSNLSRIVSREFFFIPWQSPKDVKTDPDMLLALFEDAVCQCTDESSSLEERITDCLPLYRNMILLNQLLGRWEAAVRLCETLLESCPSCCELLESLAELYIQKEETEKAFEVWLGALRNNPHNGKIFYNACRLLVLQEKSHTIAPLFQEFVMSFCETAASEQHPVNVLRHLLNIPVQNNFRAPCIKQEVGDSLNKQIPFMWLIYCLWQSVHANVGEAVDAFERALGTVMQHDVVQRLWLDYLLFTSSRLIGSKFKNRDFKMFTDLVHRCLVTVPTRFTVPFSSADYWTNFQFHNKVISFYLDCLPQSQQSSALERLRYIMPTNTELALRLLRQEWRDGNIQHLKLQARMLTTSIPNCLANWKIAIAVENELKGRAEVCHLYRQALLKLPLCATLWKDRLLYEAAEGGKTDKLRKLVDKCQEMGVSLDEPLNLGSSRTEGKDH